MRALALAALPVLAACSNYSGETYVLYRNSALDRMDQQSSRIHVATFDVAAPGQYNFENCQIAARLFGAQEGVVTTFWCEKK